MAKVYKRFQLDEDWRISGGPTCWSVEKRLVSEKGGETWSALYHHYDFDYMIQCYAKEVSRIVDAEDVKEYSNFLKRIERHCKETLQAYNKAGRTPFDEEVKNGRQNQRVIS